jgi:hypothetical protein
MITPDNIRSVLIIVVALAIYDLGKLFLWLLFTMPPRL